MGNQTDYTRDRVELNGVTCPACGHYESDTKHTRRGVDYIRRRRECTECGHRFTTKEYVVSGLKELAEREAHR